METTVGKGTPCHNIKIIRVKKSYIALAKASVALSNNLWRRSIRSQNFDFNILTFHQFTTSTGFSPLVSSNLTFKISREQLQNAGLAQYLSTGYIFVSQ